MNGRERDSREDLADRLGRQWGVTHEDPESGLALPAAKDLIAARKKDGSVRLSEAEVGRVRSIITGAWDRLHAGLEGMVPPRIRQAVKLSTVAAALVGAIAGSLALGVRGQRELSDLVLTSHSTVVAEDWERWGGAGYWYDAFMAGIAATVHKAGHDVTRLWDAARLNEDLLTAQDALTGAQERKAAVVSAHHDRIGAIMADPERREAYEAEIERLDAEIAAAEAARDTIVRALERETGPYHEGGTDLKRHLPGG